MEDQDLLDMFKRLQCDMKQQTKRIAELEFRLLLCELVVWLPPARALGIFAQAALVYKA